MFGPAGTRHPLYPRDRPLTGAGAFIFGCEGTELTPRERRFFRDADPWGFILFARNIDTPDQVRALTASLRETVGRNAPILIDQEGGRVARLRPPQWQGWLPALEQMALTKPGRGGRAMWLRYRLIAAELRALGIDVNCAPIADIPTASVHPVIRNRCYGGDAETVTAAARAVADGLLAGGVLPVLKHIPGHGRPMADSHVDLPRTDAPADTLRAVDFAPFRGLADLPLGMTAHVVYEAFDRDTCATLSPLMVGLIRDEIGFDGLLMSDDISMQALSGPLGARARDALWAGCDVVLHCNANGAEMQAVASESGTMTDAAIARATRALDRRVSAPDTLQSVAPLHSRHGTGSQRPLPPVSGPQRSNQSDPGRFRFDVHRRTHRGSRSALP